MKEWTLNDLYEEYSLDLDKAVKTIIENDAKLVLVQFPDGLKQYATSIVDYLNEHTEADFLIYLGDCYGACDTPVGMEDKGIDLMIQFGHNPLQPSYLTR
jgi:2-(3-amino-3-carboxypropyl)histidine synthase